MITHTYRSLIKSKLDYGNFIYQSARKTYLKILNPISHRGLRLVLGTFKTSPLESLYAEAIDAPANIRSNKLVLQNHVKLKSCPSNPAYDGAFYLKYKELFKRSERAIKSFGLWMETIKEEARINLTKRHNTIIPKIPPWTIKIPKVILTLCKLQKTKTHPLPFQEELEKIKDKYPRRSDIFTDGSKQEKTSGCTAVEKQLKNIS